MNVLGRNLVTGLCQQLKTKIFVVERCGFHTTIVTERRHTKGTFRYVPIALPIEKIANNPLKALKVERSGGRGPDGRIWNHRRAGGNKRLFRVVDNCRTDLENGEPRLEQVIYTRYDPNRSALIAAVAGGDRKRFIIASENMKPGDIITTSCYIPPLTVRSKEGDSYPLGALALNTIIHNVERVPGEGGKIAKAAGAFAKIAKKIGDNVIVKMPSNREVTLPRECMASVGQVSNIDHSTIPMGSPNRKRRLGIRPRSGLFKKKMSISKQRRRDKINYKEYAKYLQPQKVFQYTF